VRYDRLIEATRAQAERRSPRAPLERLSRSALFALFPHPARLRATVPLLWAYQRLGGQSLVRSAPVARLLPARLRAMEAVLPPVRLRSLMLRPPEMLPAQGTRRLRVGLLLGCVQRVFFDPVNAATARVLAAEGCEVVIPREQGCCGALSVHAGREAEGLRLARQLTDTFNAAQVEVIAVNSAGCGSTLKEYGHLLRDDPVYAARAIEFAAKVRDVSEVLADLPPVAPRHPLPLRVAYHDACHLAHAQGIRRQPRDLLRSIPELELLEVPEGELCCGSAGIYNLLQPVPAGELGERKARNVLATRPDVLAAANPGCLLHISAALRRLGTPLPTLHPIELVDASIQGWRPRA
jgi:glycolate oxidase iron-sulfur subunit